MSGRKWMALNVWHWLAVVGLLHLLSMAGMQVRPQFVWSAAVVAALLCGFNWRRMTTSASGTPSE